MFKKLMPIWSVLICLAMLMGCSSTPSAPSAQGGETSSQTSGTESKPADPGKLEVIQIALTAEAPAVEGMNEVLDLINPRLAEKNIKAELLEVPADGWVPFYQKLMALQAAGNAPALARIAEFYMPVMISKNQIADLTDRLGELDMDAYFEKAFQGASVVDGKTYGVPSGQYSVVMYFNKDLFDAAGLSYPSQNWDKPTALQEVAELARKLTSGSGADKIYGFGTHTSILHVEHYLKGNGGPGVYDENYKCLLMEPLNLEVYQLFSQMAVQDKSMLNSNDTKVMGAADLFREGRLAIYVDGTWNQSTFRNIDKFTPGIAAVPGKEGKGCSASFLDQWVIPAGSKQQDAAWETLKEILAEDSQTILFNRSLFGITVTKNVLEKSLDEYVGPQFNETDREVFVESLNRLIPAPYTPAYSELNPRYEAELSQLTLGTLTAEQAVANMVEVCDTMNARAG